MRRATPIERPRPDRWLVSYADLVTLLLACFATAFAAASEPRAEPAPPSALPAAPIALPLSPPPSLREVLAPALAIGEVPVELVQDERGLVISLPESATFSSGRADLTPEARTFLSQLAEKLRPSPVVLRVEGHTDDRPIHGGAYATNWERSTARASAVVLYLITNAGFEPARLSAAGYGEFHPRVPNDGPDNRSRNRRVDVVVIDRPGPRERPSR